MVIHMVNKSKSIFAILHHLKKCQIFLWSYYTIYNKLSEVSPNIADTLKYIKRKKKDIIYKKRKKNQVTDQKLQCD